MFITNFYCQNLLRILIYLAIFIYAIIANPVNANSPFLVIPQSESHDSATANYYPEKLLKLALQKTEASDGKVEVRFYPAVIGRNRSRVILMNKQGLDVIWSSSNHHREEQLLAVKFNLYKGLSEYKILLIRTEDQKQFSEIKTLDDLRHLKAGTGTHWQDTQVLTFNDMRFVTSWDYEPMFKMLAAKRFDYMVRSAHEVWSEVTRHSEFPLMAEQTLLLHYHQPVYYFVHKENTVLAERILRGLNLAQADGSLDALLNSVPGFKIAAEEIHNKQRRILELENPEQ
ncbi:MAG: transporter substrate-binding domain-containing protein [Pseudomonadota bacterium]